MFEETLSFLDEYLYEECLKITPDKSIDFIEENIRTVPCFTNIIHFFYGKNYIMTIDYKKLK